MDSAPEWRGSGADTLRAPGLRPGPSAAPLTHGAVERAAGSAWRSWRYGSQRALETAPETVAAQARHLPAQRAADVSWRASMGAAGRRNSAGRSGLRCSEGVGASLEAACARIGLDRHTGQSRQGHPGRRERVADALFKADVPAIEGRLQSRGGAQIGARGHDAEHA